jgi:GNAT superfamily N-acetyltransferase
VRATGLRGPARALRVYASAETHTWIQKAADLSGIGTDAIRWIPTDDGLRMDTGALRAAIERDRAPATSDDGGGTAGSVSTGAWIRCWRSPRRSAARWGPGSTWTARTARFAAAVPGTPPDLRALGLADSVAVDPHKWLYAPLEAGCVLVRDPETLRDAFAYHPPYYHFGEEAVNYVDFGPQNSRGFRALKVWLALRQVGREGYVRMIGDDIRLSERLHARRRRAPGAGGAHAGAQHQHLPLRARGPARRGRRGGDGDVPGRAQPGAARADPGLGRGVRLERGGARALPAAALHRELPHGRGATWTRCPEIVARLGGELDAARRPGSDTVDLCWDMVARSLHGEGLGRLLVEERLARIRADGTVRAVTLNTSQRTVGFYEAFGFVVERVVPDGYAPGLDRCDMRLVLAVS